METIYYAASNPGKMLSAQKYLGEYNLELVNIDFDEPEINNIEAIAIWKAKQAYEKIGKPCIALDSGFYIPSFPDEPYFPGAFVKRKLVEGIGIDGLIERMKGVTDRSCYFLECVAYYDGESLKTFFGKSPGTLADKMSDVVNTSGWSNLNQVFIPAGLDRPLSEITEEEKKNRTDITHAFLELKKYFDQKECNIKVRRKEKCE